MLDPFCRCATTCVAAELAERRWAAIDLSETAVHLLRKRLANHAARDADLYATGCLGVLAISAEDAR